MAFDQPLEADRVEDLGFISTFVRAPIVGTLMWILGGDEAKKQEEQEQMKEQMGITDPKPASLNKMIENNRKRKAGKKTAPRLIGSDISDFGDCAIQAEAELMANLQLNDGVTTGVTTLQRRGSKRLSWSDESGQSLVDYVDETSVAREPSSTSASTQGKVKSVMKRSRSMRNASGPKSASARNSSPSRYIPKGLSANHNGLIMPTKPYNNNDDGYVSPQWGWYINTTPPTPDMYHRNSSITKPHSSMDSAAFHKRPATLTNPAFNKQKGHIHHWPSVPL